MAYVIGNAASISDVATALSNACTDNGWALSNGVISKGNCYAKITADVANDRLSVRVGLGETGGALTDAAPADVYLMKPLNNLSFSYPMQYCIHVVGDEVYLICNYQTSYYVLLAFGQSPVPGMPGTGVWCSGTGYVSTDGGGSFSWASGSIAGSYYASANNSARTGLFIVSTGDGATSAGCYVHHGLTGWSGLSSALPKTYQGCRDLTYLDNPSTNWNAQTVLVPIQPWIDRGSSKVSIVADLQHARYVRLDNLEPQDVITLGADKWRVYPVYRKDASARNGGGSHSGTFGYAIRYDGP